jgi:hypothetical protein
MENVRGANREILDFSVLCIGRRFKASVNLFPDIEIGLISCFGRRPGLIILVISRGARLTSAVSRDNEVDNK